MSRIPIITIDGKFYLWKDILELRRSQMAAICETQAKQQSLFETLHKDYRTVNTCTVSKRYIQPNLFETGI